MSAAPIGWFGIFRFGLGQMAIGAIAVLTTSTLNRVMVIELALPAMLPGALVGFHYAVQLLRPRWGYGSDLGGRRTPWIIGGMAVLATGAILASLATVWMATNTAAGIALAVVAFLLIGGGVGACGTSLLVLLALCVDDRRRAAAATIVWLMMIAGLAMTAGIAGHLLDPFSAQRLVAVTVGVCAVAMVLTLLAFWGIERPFAGAQKQTEDDEAKPGFMEALRQVWSEPLSRRFAVFVFVSMLAYSAQDLILEPFSGAVFGLTPGESTQLSGVHHSGVFLGMVVFALAGSVIAGGRFGSFRAWVIGGCLASAGVLFLLASASSMRTVFPLTAAVFALGLANGAFAVAAIGSMMGLVRKGREQREGTRMGLWGAAQAIAFGLGGFAGTVAVDSVRYLTGSPETAYASVFAAEGVLFILSAYLAARVTSQARASALGLTEEKPASPRAMATEA